MESLPNKLRFVLSELSARNSFGSALANTLNVNAIVLSICSKFAELLRLCNSLISKNVFTLILNIFRSLNNIFSHDSYFFKFFYFN